MWEPPEYESPPPSPEEARHGLLESISYNLGPQVAEALEDPEVIEIMLNPDGGLWVEKFSVGMSLIGHITPYQASLALTFIASALGTTVTRERPIIEGTLPIGDSRFEGVIPPVVAAPSFTIRKGPAKIFTFDEYVAAGNLSLVAKELLEQAVIGHKNILIAGGTGSGKTTFINAVIEAIARLTPHDRLIVIEDTAELKVASPNKMEMRTSTFADRKELLKTTMRLRPDRILVGEVRDAGALTMAKAWNTGHPGGLGTIHADSAEETMSRLEELIAEVGVTPSPRMLGRAIDYIVFMRRELGIRRVTEIVAVGYSRKTRDYTFDYLYKFRPA